jgi:tyrosine-protein kinase Etk/Wzc
MMTKHPSADTMLVSSVQFSLFDILVEMLMHKRLLVLGPLLVTLVVGALAFLEPNYYRANTKILPPQQAQSGAAAVLAQLGGVGGAAAGAVGIKNPNELYIGMLRSRTIADQLIDKHKLFDVYDKRSMEQVRKVLAKKTSISSGKDNLITIEVEDTDPKRAAAIANDYTASLLALTKVIAVTEAGQRRLFYERQLDASRTNLENAELKLRTALGNGGISSVDSESRAIVETVARLRAQIAAKEIEARTMQNFMTGQNPDVQKVQAELASARAELDRLEQRGNGTSSRLDPAGLENMKLLREVKYHQMLYELLAKQFEVARLDESKDASIIQVLDTAVPPEQKAGPARAVTAVSSGLLTLAVLLLYVAGRAKLRHCTASPAVRERMQLLRSHWR